MELSSSMSSSLSSCCYTRTLTGASHGRDFGLVDIMLYERERKTKTSKGKRTECQTK